MAAKVVSVVDVGSVIDVSVVSGMVLELVGLVVLAVVAGVGDVGGGEVCVREEVGRSASVVAVAWDVQSLFSDTPTKSADPPPPPAPPAPPVAGVLTAGEGVGRAAEGDVSEEGEFDAAR